MAERKQTATRTVRKAPKPKPWWDGLSAGTARELQRRGYQSKDDAMLFLDRPRFAGRSQRVRTAPYDPLHLSRPWLNEGVPMRISLDLFNEVRQWLGGDPVSTG